MNHNVNIWISDIVYVAPMGVVTHRSRTIAPEESVTGQYTVSPKAEA